MPISLGDALLKLGLDKTEFDKAMKETSSKIESSLKGMQTQLRVAGAAFTALGAAGLKFVSDAKALNAQLGQTALTLGVSTKEMRNLALSTTDVTFPLKSVAATFELLARAGVRNTEIMKQNANAFDALADATGSSAEVVADILIPAFKSLGVQIPRNSSDLDKFTWLTKNTTINLEDFGSVMQYVAMYGADLNITIDDMIGIMAALEARGITGSAATRLFRTAVTQAKDGAVTLNEALGVTKEQIDGYTAKIQLATGITDEYAKVANSNVTILDRLKQTFSEISFRLGTLFNALEPVFAAFTALGPVLLFFSTSMGIAATKTIIHTAAVIAHTVAVKAAAAAQWLWNTALLANPVTAIIAGVAALTAGIVMMFRSGESSAKKFAKEVEKLAKEMAAARKIELADEQTAMVAAMEGSKELVRKEYDDAVTLIRRKYGILKTEDGLYTESKLDQARKATEGVKKLYDQEISYDKKALSAKLKSLATEYDARMKLVDAESSTAIRGLQDQIDALDVQTTAEEQAARDRERVQRLAELQLAVDTAETFEDQIKASQDLADYKSQITLEQNRDAREIEKDSLRKQMDAIRDAAQEEKDRLATELQDKQDAEQAFYDLTVERLEKQKDALDVALEETLKRIDDERIAMEAAEVSKLAYAQATLTQLAKDQSIYYANALAEATLFAEAMAKAMPIVTEKRETEAKEFWENQPVPVLPGFQHGGIIPEPTVLYGLKSMRPYAVAGEAGTEYVVPQGGGGSGGYRTANIQIYLDGRLMGEALGQPLVDLIRARTGVKI